MALTIISRAMLASALLVLALVFFVLVGNFFQPVGRGECPLFGGYELDECLAQVAYHNANWASMKLSIASVLVGLPVAFVAIAVWFWRGVRRKHAATL